MMLDRYNAAEATSVEQVEWWLQSDYPGARCSTSSDRTFRYRVNAAKLPRIGLTFSNCSTASEATLPPAGLVRQIIPLATAGQLTIGRQPTKAITSAGCLVPPDEIMRISHGDGYEQLAVRIELSVLETALTSMVGARTKPLTFDFEAARDRRKSHLLRQAAINLAEEINLFGPDLSTAALAELEQTLIIRFLLYTDHNHSELLLKTPATTSTSAVERAENYIRDRWSEPLDFEALSRSVDTSVRSLFRTFKQTRGYTPSEYAKRLRLEHANAMILRDSSASIMSIALKCGFHNIGRFAEEYHSRFGELPSQTRKRNK